MKKYTEDDLDTMILDDLLRFADHNKEFNRDYVDKVYDFLEKNGYITESQLDILNEIYYKALDKNFCVKIYDEY